MSGSQLLAPGITVDRYRVEALLGEGGMATVWRVRHTVLESAHALKVLRPELVAMPELRDRFLAEGRIHAQLQHPHIVQVTDVVAVHNIAGLVMELLKGRTLEERVLDEGPLAPTEVVDVFVPLLDALAWAHDHNIVHRDVKPANLFLAVGTRGRVRPVLVDFGVAKLKEAAGVSTPRTRHTSADVRVGTVHYMSPEQVRDPRDVDARSDLFSLGATLYEALTGQLAFPGESEFEVQQRIVEGHMADPGVALPREARPLVEVVRRALAVRREDRYQDALAFADALTRAVRGPQEPPSWAKVAHPAPPEPAPPPPPQPATPVAPPVGEVFPASAAWLETAGGRRSPLGEGVVYLHGLRGTVEPWPRGGVRFSHARLEPVGGGWALEPHGVTMPIRLDGEVVKVRCIIHDGQRIQIDQHTFTYRKPEG